MVERFENFLRRLKVCDERVVPLDWDDHQKWYWNTYKQRVQESEQRKSKLKVCEGTMDRPEEIKNQVG